MEVVHAKVFKTGNSAAVRLPRELGFPPGTPVVISKNAFGINIRVEPDREAIRRNNEALAAELTAIWAEAGGPPPGDKRDPDIFPDRPGLY